VANDRPSSNPTEGTVLGGFAIAFCLGCVGFAAVWFLPTGMRTKKGAVFGLIAATAVGCVIWLTVFAIVSLGA
jgi:hypothetical protein